MSQKYFGWHAQWEDAPEPVSAGFEAIRGQWWSVLGPGAAVEEESTDTLVVEPYTHSTLVGGRDAEANARYVLQRVQWAREYILEKDKEVLEAIRAAEREAKEKATAEKAANKKTRERRRPEPPPAEERLAEEVVVAPPLAPLKLDFGDDDGISRRARLFGMAVVDDDDDDFDGDSDGEGHLHGA